MVRFRLVRQAGTLASGTIVQPYLYHVYGMTVGPTELAVSAAPRRHRRRWCLGCCHRRPDKTLTFVVVDRAFLRPV